MTYRLIQCAFWNDPWVIELPPAEKLLYCWMFSNEHTNAAGIYQVGRKTILHETGLAPTLLDRIIDNFMKAKKIIYTADNLLWVKNFLRHQPNQSPKVLKRILLDLRNIKDRELVEEFLIANEGLFPLSSGSGIIKLSQNEAIAIRDRLQCQYCQKIIEHKEDSEIDHVESRESGGRTNYENLVLACLSCNQKKSKKTLEELGWCRPLTSKYQTSQALKELSRNSELLKRFNDFTGRDIDLEALKDTLSYFEDTLSLNKDTVSNHTRARANKLMLLSSSSLESKNLKAKKHYSLEEIGAIITYLNEKAGKAFKTDSELSVTVIRARLEDGWTPDDLKKVIDIKAAKWKGRTTTDRDTGQVTVWDDFLRPATLFRKSKFEGYRNEAMTGEGRRDDWAERKEAELRKKRGEG